MALLPSKDTVLKLLNPQPQDGAGPGYISAADVKQTCENLYDLIATVNEEMTMRQAEILALLQVDQDTMRKLYKEEGTLYTDFLAFQQALLNIMANG